MLCIERTYTDNTHYSERFVFFDELVDAIECLYAGNRDNLQLYNINANGFMMPDFMTCVDYFITAAIKKQGKVTINDYIHRMSTGKNGYYSPMELKYIDSKGKKLMACISFNYYIIEAILWTAYIYCLLLSEISKDNIPKWKDATNILYECMFIYSKEKTKELFERHSELMQIRDETMVKFIKALSEKNSQEPEDASTNRTIRVNETDKPGIETTERTQLRVRIQFALSLLGIEDPSIVPNKSALCRLLSVMLNEDAEIIRSTLNRRYEGKLYGLSEQTHGEDIKLLNKLIKDCKIPSLDEYIMEI